MKNILSIFALVLLAGLISCEKDPVVPTPGPEPVKKTATINITFGPIPEGMTLGNKPSFALTDEETRDICLISYSYPNSKLVLSGVEASTWLGKTVLVFYGTGTLYYGHESGQSTFYRIEKLQEVNNVYIPIQLSSTEDVFYLP